MIADGASSSDDFYRRDWEPVRPLERENSIRLVEFKILEQWQLWNQFLDRRIGRLAIAGLLPSMIGQVVLAE